MSLSRLLALVAWVLLSSISLVSAQTLDRQPRLTRPNAEGHLSYIVDLNLDAVESVEAHEMSAARNTMDPANEADFRGWHKPKVRKLVSELERDYGIKAETMTSYAMPSFSAHISEQVIEKIRRDPRVDKVLLIYEAADFSQVPPWTDQPGAETIPWGKAAVGTDDTLGTSNVVYMIDAGMPPANNDLLNIIATPVNPGIILSTAHASHVAGILSAAMNGVQVRGVNPSAMILNVNRGGTDAEIRTALDWVLADAESRGIYAVANISSNSDRWAENHPSEIATFMRRLSNRVLVVQSAGNGDVTNNVRQDACTVAYGPAKLNDGILVVSGVDQLGQQAIPFDNTGVGPGWIREPGANWGPCVEVWAPAQQVLSTWDLHAAATQVLSGTSMAAPHVSALAARFGSSATTPVERESHIRARLRATGTDERGATIVVPSYLQAPSFVIPTRLWNLTATADSTAAGTSTAYVSDGLYLSPNIWNSGHAAPAWIEFDLVYPRTLASIRLTPEQFPSGGVVHQIYVGNATPPTTLVATISQNSQNLAALATGLNSTVGRYVRVLTTSSPSWIAWREVEVYGTLRTDETTMDWFYLGLLNRAADAGGYSFWLNQLRVARCSDPNSVHGALNSINASFIYGAEFQSQGLSNQAYVVALYEGVLRRAADPGGLAYWTGELDSGARTREDVRLNFVYSIEFYIATVAPIMSESCTSI